MTDWRRYWQERPTAHAEEEFCQQVGRTYGGGKPTPPEELALVVEQALARLECPDGARVLDLCCGNGLLTHRLRPPAAEVLGVDYSEPMIELARRHHQRDGVRYVCGSVLDLPDLLRDERPFDRAVMFESLQYFEERDLPRLFEAIGAVCAPSCVLLFTGVLDVDRLWSFYDTPERRAAYHRRKAAGEDAMGHWFAAERLCALAAAAGLEAQVAPQDPALNTAHYRFDLQLRRGS